SSPCQDADLDSECRYPDPREPSDPSSPFVVARREVYTCWIGGGLACPPEVLGRCEMPEAGLVESFPVCGVSAMTAQERIEAHLRKHEGLFLCASCLGHEIGVSQPEARS